MVRTRSVLIAVVALGLGAGACKKNEENKAAGADKAAAGDTATAQGASGGAVAAGDDLSLLPADSEVVMGLNFAQLRQSALWKQFGPKLMESASEELTKFKTECGFDPFESVKSVSLGLKGVGGDQPDGAVVIRGLDKAKSMACFDKMKAEAAKDGAEITVDGDVVLVKNKNGNTVASTFLGADTMLVTLGAAGTKDGVLAAAKGGSALKTSATFVDMYSKINTKDSLWVLVNGNASFMQQAAQAGIKPKAVFGSLNVTDGLNIDFRMRVDSPDQATQMANAFKGQVAGFAQMADKLDITSDGPDVKLVVAMSQQKLENAIKNLGAMMGGAMMGGGAGAGAP